MKKYFFGFVLCFISVILFAQKKAVPVSQSALTGISLTAGSKKDERMLSVTGAEMLLEMESKKANVVLSNTEVLLLPTVSTGGFNRDTLVQRLSALGWTSTAIKDDEKYAWLQKGTRHIIIYFSSDKKETLFYLAEAKTAPVLGPPQSVVGPQSDSSKTGSNSGYSFTSSNFDDGWVAMEQSDWVRVTKGNSVVLLHFVQPDIKGFNILDEATAFAWNIIVAPRYKNISNLWIRKSWYADGDFMNGKYFAEADLTDNASSKRVHVVLYRNGNGGKWIEIITPDKASFQNQFSIVYQQDGTNWDKLSVMTNYNKFAVSEKDLPGSWYSSGGSNIQYYNVYTGNNAGMAFASSNTEIIFEHGGNYKSFYKGVDNTLNNSGNRYYGETFTGNYTVTNWEMKLTNRFKGATETFAIQFEAIKGGRILHMYRGSVEELHLFKLK
jgi:hypothetical protein